MMRTRHSFVNTVLPSALCLLGGSWSLGCGSPAPPPASADSVVVTPPESEPGATPTDESEADSEWEGEADATRSSAASDDVASGAPKTQETRTTELIAKLIQDNRQPFRDCYEKAAKDQPDLKGTMTLHFVLDGEGKVKLAELNRERSTIQSPAVVDCSLAVLRAMQFPSSSRGMESTVNYPFNFNR